MKRLVGAILCLSLVAGIGSNVRAAEERGEVASFFVGCCLGLRTATAYNEGKDLHYRDWCRLIPYVNIVFGVWDGIDASNGITTEELATQYGGSFY